MSSLVNPITFRLAFVKYWNNNWCCSTKINYSFLNQQDYYIFKYIENYLLNKKFLFNECILSNIKIIRLNNILNVYIYIKNQKFCLFLFKHYNWFNVFENNKIEKNWLGPFSKDKPLLKKKLKLTSFLVNIKKLRNLNKYIISTLKNNYIIFSFIFNNMELYLNKKFNFCTYFKFYNKTYVRYKNLKRSQRKKKKKFLIKYFFVIFSFISYKYLYFWWKILLRNNLKKLLKNNHLIINVYFIIHWLNYFSAFFLGQFIKHKLLLNYPIGHIIYNLNKVLTRARLKKIIFGFKILFSGRFTRKDRKTHKWVSKGWLAYNTMYSNLDYHLTLVILLNSLCGIKIWLNKGSNQNLVNIF